MAAYQNPSVADFKNYFSRDFPFGEDIETSVTDADITKAMTQTVVSINQGLFCNQPSYTIGFQLLTAHFLVLNLRSSSQGINGQYSFLESSKSVGSVSQSFSIPQRILDNPLWAMFMKTNYGAMYIEMIFPMLTGQVFTVMGTTLP